MKEVVMRGKKKHGAFLIYVYKDAHFPISVK